MLFSNQQNEIDILKEDNKQLRTMYSQLQQYTMKEDVIINGVPNDSNGESMNDLAEKISKATGLKFQPWEVKAALRLPNVKTPNAQPIIMRFHTYELKERVIKVFREKEPKASIFRGPPERIYYNEHNTKEVTILKRKARQMLPTWKFARNCESH